MPPTPSSKSLRSEIGETGTVMIGGIISNQDYNAEMVGTKGLRNIDQMRKSDATVRAASLVVKLPILSAHWFVEPASKDDEDVRIAQFVEKQIFEEMTVTWLDFLRETLLYLDYGRYVWEIVWKDVVFEGKSYIGLHKLSPRLPATIHAWQTQDGKDGITQWTMGRSFVSIPMEKLVIFTYEKEGDNWEGTSIFRSAYKNYYIKDALYKIDAIAHERQGLGIPYVKRQDGAGASKADQDKAAEILQNLRANEQGYLDIPDGWDVGFMDMKAGSAKDAMKSIQHHDRQIVKSVLAQFLELGATSSGSYALGADQSDIFLLALNSLCEQIKNTVQKYLVEKLVRYNFNTQKMPKLQYSKLGKKDIANLSTAIQRIVQVGALTPDAETEVYLRNIMDLPELPVDKIKALRDEAEEKKNKQEETFKEDAKSNKPKKNSKQKAAEGEHKRFLGFVQNFRDSIRDIAHYVKGS
jgi:hypothetical protein